VKECLTVNLGLAGYAGALALQRRIAAARKTGSIGDVLLLCEHPHVITQGRNGRREHLLVSDSVLRQKNIEYFETSRGGGITYHGPGQIVGYPILDLNGLRRDVGWYVRQLEETMLRATAGFGISAGREAGKTGVWVARPDGPPEKIGAIGVHLSRWVTSHGFAYNVSTDLRYFGLIVPCGISGRAATSLEKLLDRRVACAEVLPLLVRHFGEAFGLVMRHATPDMLLGLLEAAERQLAVSA